MYFQAFIGQITYSSLIQGVRTKPSESRKNKTSNKNILRALSKSKQKLTLFLEQAVEACKVMR
jgi:hypothetical protein